MAPRKNYTPEQMGKAIEAVRNGEKVAAAAKLFAVPRITLLNKITGKTAVGCTMGPDTILSKEQEDVLVKWISAMADKHYPITKDCLQDSVQKIITDLKLPNPFTDNRPGKKWYKSFLKRHPEVVEKVAENLSKARDNVSEEDIRRWFDEINTYLEENNLKEVVEDPSRVFNADESAFFLSPKPGRVLARKGEKHLYNVCGDEKDNLTVLFTGNASGQLAPPMIVFNYERIPANIAASVPEDWGIGKSETGWMCSSTFYEYVTNVLNPWLEEKKIQKPIVFFVDGHKSHLTLHLSNFCAENGIELFALYPNSTHILQPMDLAVFRPLKVFWRKSVNQWKIENLGKNLTKDTFAPVLEKAITKVTEECIKNGFRAGGLCPFGPEYIDMSKLKHKEVEVVKSNPEPTAFLKYLEKEIVKVFSPEKLSLFNKFFYENRDTVECNLPMEDMALYIIWAKNKSECSSTIIAPVNEIVDPLPSVEPTPQTSTDIEHEIVSDANVIEDDQSNSKIIESQIAAISEKEKDTDYNNLDELEECVRFFESMNTEPISLPNTEPINNSTVNDNNVISNSMTTSELRNESRFLEGKTDTAEKVTGSDLKSNPTDKSGIEEQKDMKSLSTSNSNHLISASVLEDLSPGKNIAISCPIMCVEPDTVTPQKNNSESSVNVDIAIAGPSNYRTHTVVTGPSNYRSDTVTPQKSSMDATFGMVVPSPFKRNLFWPDNDNNKKKKRIKKEKIPYSITSKAWREYHTKKEAEKKKLETEKQERAKIRQEKKMMREKIAEQKKMNIVKKKLIKKTIQEKTLSKSDKKNKRKKAFDDSTTEESDSQIKYDTSGDSYQEESDEGDYHSEGEEKENQRKRNKQKENVMVLERQLKRKKIDSTDNTSDSETDVPIQTFLTGPKKKINPGTYVIVLYEGEYFPGKVENTNASQYEVSTMALSMGNSYRWPEKPDKIWYRQDQVIETIKEPVCINKRGFFKITEMEKYLPDIYTYDY